MNTYKIKKFSDTKPYQIYSKDKSGREINFYKIKNCAFVNESIFYPDVKIYSYYNDTIYNPLDEKIMSLDKIDKDNEYKFSPHSKSILKKCEDKLFYFIYNTDNYYHFLYDTLPYLITYQKIKQKYGLKLLMNLPNSQSKKLYDFTLEFLNLLDVTEKDIVFVEKNVLYKELFISDSYTHGIDSNLPPRKEIYHFYTQLKDKVKNENYVFPKKFYVSRRSWLHGNFSNIGTNYTTRRNMENENDLVNFLSSLGYVEIFTELLSTKEKINLFANASHIVGSIGGGLANVLFSNNECKLYCICSPVFLDINQRFTYSFANVNTILFKDTEHIESGEFKKFMRVKYKNIVGEIVSIKNDKVVISYLDEIIAGWNNSMDYKEIEVDKSECDRLDNGLNSAFKIDLEKFKKIML